MFEKEAEEKAFEKYPIPPNWDSIHLARNSKYEEGFQDGAEFGYNKANEWHKSDEKPKATKEYLVYLISGYSCHSVTTMIYNAERGFWCADSQNDVVYWKEIVLPKEIDK